MSPGRGLLPVVAFFALAYLFTWAWWVPLAASDELVRRGDGRPTHIPGLLGPAVAAFVVLALTEGRRGVRPWLAAMVRVPSESRWRLAAVAPLGFLAVGVLIAAVFGELPPARDYIAFSGTAAGVAPFVLAVSVSALGEESGWRGYALPRLQDRFGPLRATATSAHSPPSASSSASPPAPSSSPSSTTTPAASSPWPRGTPPTTCRPRPSPPTAPSPP